MVMSIVIPTYNTAEMTLACARAAIAAAPDAQVIVADDASTDGTRERITAALPEVTVVRLESNRRFAGAANAGLAMARGDLLLLLNSDAVIDRAAIAAFRAAFDDAKLGIAGARLLHPDGSPQWSGGPKPTMLWLLVMISGIARWLPRRRRPAAAKVDWVSGAAMMFRREVWDAVGPLHEDFQFYAQDVDFCIRAGEAGWKVRVVDGARVLHAMGATKGADRAMLIADLLAWGRMHYGPLWSAVMRPLAALVRVVDQSPR